MTPFFNDKILFFFCCLLSNYTATESKKVEYEIQVIEFQLATILCVLFV